jgi:hypothetical protein
MKRTLAIAMAMLIGLPTAQGDEPASRPSKTVKAFREVRIDAPDVYLDVVQDFEKDYLSAIWQEDAPPPIVHIEQSAVNDAPVLLISVEAQVSAGAPADAAETADRIVRQLRSRLAMLTQQRRAVWKSAMDARYAEDQRLEQQGIALRAQLGLQRGDMDKVATMAGLADPSPQSVRELSHTLEAQYEATKIDIEGKTARQAALAAAIARLHDQVAQKLSADPIAEQLQQVVNVRQKQLDNMQHAKDAYTDEDIGNAVAVLAGAKAAVLERREAAAHAAGADIIQKWNNDLLSLSIDLDELHARMTTLKGRLETLTKAIEMMEGEPSMDSLWNSLDEVEDRLSKLSEPSPGDLRAAEPKLTLVESRDVPAGKS